MAKTHKRRSHFHRAGIVAKPHGRVQLYLRRTLLKLRQLGVEAVLEKSAAGLLRLKDGVERERLAADCDILVVLGGDGTFLSVAKSAVEAEIPIAGFNLGSLGFLTEMKKECLEENLEEIFSGRARISERKLLAVRHRKNCDLALNDVVISKGQIARIVNLSLEIEGSRITEIKGDGVIIATPTGSTAYSLSAGGPIVSPDVNGVIITPICPHSLTYRPLIVPDTSLLIVQLKTPNIDTYMTIDGQRLVPFHYQDRIEVCIHSKRLFMVVSPQVSYFKLLSEKLNWGV